MGRNEVLEAVESVGRRRDTRVHGGTVAGRFNPDSSPRLDIGPITYALCPRRIAYLWCRTRSKHSIRIKQRLFIFQSSHSPVSAEYPFLHSRPNDAAIDALRVTRSRSAFLSTLPAFNCRCGHRIGPHCSSQLSINYCYEPTLNIS